MSTSVRGSPTPLGQLPSAARSFGIVENVRELLEDVDAAAAKIDDGSYGVCESCGKPIGAARMEYRSTSRFCFDCKSKQT